MHSLEGIVKLNSDDKALNYARALNLGSASPDAPKSEEKTGVPRNTIVGLGEKLGFFQESPLRKHIRSKLWPLRPTAGVGFTRIKG